MLVYKSWKRCFPSLPATHQEEFWTEVLPMKRICCTLVGYIPCSGCRAPTVSFFLTDSAMGGGGILLTVAWYPPHTMFKWLYMQGFIRTDIWVTCADVIKQKTYVFGRGLYCICISLNKVGKWSALFLPTAFKTANLDNRTGHGVEGTACLYPVFDGAFLAETGMLALEVVILFFLEVYNEACLLFIWTSISDFPSIC